MGQQYISSKFSNIKFQLFLSCCMRTDIYGNAKTLVSATFCCKRTKMRFNINLIKEQTHETLPVTHFITAISLSI